MSNNLFASHDKINIFLQNAGITNFAASIIPSDASDRKYYRLTTKNANYILMDDSIHSSLFNFINIAEQLKQYNLSSPKIFHYDIRNGFAVIEDFGNKVYSKILQSDCKKELYQLAIDTLIHLRKQSVPNFLPTYTRQKFIEELSYFIHSIDKHINKINNKQRDEYFTIWNNLLPIILAESKSWVLKDYHVDNIILLPQYDSIKKCGLLDFQDALAGPAIYDFVSLLEDERVFIDTTLYQDLLNYYIQQTSESNVEKFHNIFAIIAAHRHIKIIGLFIKFAQAGKPKYLQYIPRSWQLLINNCQNTKLLTLGSWLKNYVAQQLLRSKFWQV